MGTFIASVTGAFCTGQRLVKSNTIWNLTRTTSQQATTLIIATTRIQVKSLQNVGFAGNASGRGGGRKKYGRLKHTCHSSVSVDSLKMCIIFKDEHRIP